MSMHQVDRVALSMLLTGHEDRFQCYDTGTTSHSFYTYCQKIVSIVAHSPMGRLLQNECATGDLSIVKDCFSGTESCLFVQDINALVFKNQPESFRYSNFFLAKDIVEYVHALRLAWHSYHKNMPNYALRVQDFIQVYRCIEADTVAVAIAVCWELRQLGYIQPWHTILTGSNRDMALFFSQETLCQDTSLQYDRETALQAAFCQWFDNLERCDECDHRALERFDAMLRTERQRDTIGQRHLSLRKLGRIGGLSLGTNYLSREILALPQQIVPESFNNMHIQHIENDIRIQTDL